MAWKILNLNLSNVPKILVKCRLDDKGYRIDLTDLSRIWSESASKDDILQRALDVGSSIDPNEDDEQFGIFLHKIESALNCEDGTSLSLTSAGEDGMKLRVDISAPLPRPLPLFEWTLQLEQQPEQQIEAEVVTPLVLHSSNLRRQIQQLIDELHDKDRVISKICDRLETSGNDLTTVFPGVSNIKTSRKKGQREQLAKHVKGLEDFDEDAWRKQSRNVSASERVDANVIDEVFRDLPSGSNQTNTVFASDWWKHLGKGSHAQLASGDCGIDNTSPKINGRQYRTASVLEKEESLQQDEFQRQVTPPHLKPNATDGNERHFSAEDISNDHDLQGKSTMDMEDESTTDDEDDLDAPTRTKPASQKPESVNKKNATSPFPKKLGTIGGRPSQPTSSQPADDGQGEEVEAPKTRSKLGSIGGKPKASTPVSMPVEDSEPGEKSPPPKASKMGVIGGKKAPKASLPFSPSVEHEKLLEAAKEPSPRRPRTPTKENPPPPRETSQERADGKRDQLKRELEDKAKAPVKKKRKF